jgi:hypothetical protein
MEIIVSPENQPANGIAAHLLVLMPSGWELVALRLIGTGMTHQASDMPAKNPPCPHFAR